jgi:toxin secretion/phage lysis holin
MLLNFLMNLYSATELKILAIAGIVGAAISRAIGGFDMQIEMLMMFVVVDYTTGMYAGWKTKQLSSQIGFRGILKKATIFIVVAFFYAADLMFNTNTLRYMAICGYGVLELVSIIENADRGGWGSLFPYFVRDKLVQIKTERKL